MDAFGARPGPVRDIRANEIAGVRQPLIAQGRLRAGQLAPVSETIDRHSGRPTLGVAGANSPFRRGRRKVVGASPIDHTRRRIKSQTFRRRASAIRQRSLEGPGAPLQVANFSRYDDRARLAAPCRRSRLRRHCCSSTSKRSRRVPRNRGWVTSNHRRIRSLRTDR